MTKYSDYILIEEASIEGLNQKVNKYLAEGWQLHGFTQVVDSDRYGGHRYYQAVYKYEYVPDYNYPVPFVPYYAPPIPRNPTEIIEQYKVTCCKQTELNND